ncbi:MAG: tRNA-dihydrouridine synthase family protein [Butyrivibrio sp.]|nr:tRNA-dihydrouridine synthase family protein [Butyrivibrio sp.]
MKYYFAPMEGITLYPLRNIHRRMFGDCVDKYFTPFLTAHHNNHFKKREKRDALPENIDLEAFDDYGHQIVPQIMSNKTESFVWAAKEMSALGYREVNLNLGCPAATVTNSHKGSGLLADTDYLDKFLDGIFENLSDESIGISLKTRLGFESEDEIENLMKVYARYPVKELTIHARVREDFYKGQPRLLAFARALQIYRENGGKADICYNGNIAVNSGNYSESEKENDIENACVTNSSISDKLKALHCYSDISAIMIGRGLLSDPALVRELNGGPKLSAAELKEYLTLLYEGYAAFIPEERNVIFKLLEHWTFLEGHFENCDKYLKAIRKSRSKGEYTAAVNNIFSSCAFISAC